MRFPLNPITHNDSIFAYGERERRIVYVYLRLRNRVIIKYIVCCNEKYDDRKKKKNDVSSYDKIRRKKVVSWYREILMEGIEDKRKRERERERENSIRDRSDGARGGR